MVKNILRGICVICLMVVLTIICLPKVHYEHCVVLEGRGGIVRLMTDDGNIYEIYGETDAVEVEATFEDNRVVHFEKIS